MRKVFTLLLIFMVFPILVYGKDITGAFGIRFGEKLNKLKIVNTKIKLDTGMIVYQVIPPKKVKFWKEYYVSFTPISHKIYAIYGLSDGLPESECEAKLEAVASILEKKYSIKRQKLSSDLDLETDKGYDFRKRDSIIVLECLKNFSKSNYYLYIAYANAKLANKAKKEKIEQETKSIKNSDAL